MVTDFGRILKLFVDRQVEFIVVGGIAAIAHGAARATFDLDLVYSRNSDNLRRLSTALQPYQPYLRGAPPGLPFVWDERTIVNGLNFTLTTAIGDLDLLGEIAGGGTYHQLLSYTIEVPMFGVNCRCVTLERLIQLKRAAGRPKDLEALAELQALYEERNRMLPPPPV